MNSIIQKVTSKSSFHSTGLKALLQQIIQPFGRICKAALVTMIILQAGIVLLFWQLRPAGLIPHPGEIAQAFGRLIASHTFFDHLLVSLLLTVKAMCFSMLITLVIAYASVIPFFKGIAAFVVKCRYLTITGLIFIFTLLTKDGSELKLWLLIFGIVPFFTTSFLSVIGSIDEQEFALCKTLGYSRWQQLYEVVIVGKAHVVIEILRQNFAIAWLMITMVEGLSMSEGGIGAMLIKFNKYNDLTNVMAMQLVIFIIGLGFDLLLGNVKHWLFPYSNIKHHSK